jgi:hypothetical protein
VGLASQSALAAAQSLTLQAPFIQPDKTASDVTRRLCPRRGWGMIRNATKFISLPTVALLKQAREGQRSLNNTADRRE